MAKVLSYKQAVGLGFVMILVVLILIFGGQLSDYLIRDPNASAFIRWLGVFVAVGSIVPWILIMVGSVGRGDEYVRQVALVGTAIAFVGDLLLHVGFNVAQHARLVSATSQIATLPVTMLLWVSGVGIAALYYRFRP